MACEAIGAEHPAAAGLIPLASLLGVSPYRLSRVFSARMGVSLTRYRNRVRAGRAVDAIEAGEARLGALAQRLGFADQAHLTRTVKAHYGHTPTALQALLRHESPEEDPRA
jgi:AraC-like DNA-binding protein